jgi:hypothetical protein
MPSFHHLLVALITLVAAHGSALAQGALGQQRFQQPKVDESLPIRFHVYQKLTDSGPTSKYLLVAPDSIAYHIESKSDPKNDKRNGFTIRRYKFSGESSKKWDRTTDIELTGFDNEPVSLTMTRIPWSDSSEPCFVFGQVDALTGPQLHAAPGTRIPWDRNILGVWTHSTIRHGQEFKLNKVLASAVADDFSAGWYPSK